MDRDEIRQWAGLYRTALLEDRAATLAEVFDAASAWLDQSRFFPTIADIGPLVDKRVIARREAAIIAAAQESATPLPQLDSGDIDWSQVRTADLPPGYDYSQDDHWQRGQAMLERIAAGNDDPGPLAASVLAIRARMDAGGGVGFQGASKPGPPACPMCADAGWVRTGGGFNPSIHDKTMGTPGSHVIRCPNCGGER